MREGRQASRILRELLPQVEVKWKRPPIIPPPPPPPYPLSRAAALKVPLRLHSGTAVIQLQHSVAEQEPQAGALGQSYQWHHVAGYSLKNRTQAHAA